MATEKQSASASRPSAYASAGVDIDSKMTGIKSIKEMVASTATAGSIGGIGNFGGLFASPGADHLLVGSADGVGTKLKVAVMANRHNTVGQDLVNHCVNDILVQGAFPLFFLDYLGASRFDGEAFKEVVWGFCKACKENTCALLGGETAELPGLYPEGEYDLVGTIIGSVPKDKVITGEHIQAGDVIIGLASGGLQTNGYSLARKVIFEQSGRTLQDLVPGTDQTFEDALLAVHRSFLKPVRKVMESIAINGMAHITGGGFVDNIPRVLPEGCQAVINRELWTPPEIFTFIEREGAVDHDEMYRVFNMGIGFVLIVNSDDAKQTMDLLDGFNVSPTVIGSIKAGERSVVFSS